MHKKKRWFTLVAIVAVLASAGAVAAFSQFKPHHRHLSTTPACLESRGSFCVGVALADVRKPELASFTRATGVFPAMVEYYQGFGAAFSTETANLVASVGSRPFIQINPHKVSMAAIASGSQDGYLKTYFIAVRKFHLPVMISFGHEMNGTWSQWSMPFTRPAAFIAAWRHIHDVAAHMHARNITWTWDISSSTKARPPAQWYPGNKYVDWVGIDGYLRPGSTFAGRFWHSIDVVRKLSNDKPLFIAETAVAPGPAQVSQIHDLFNGAKRRHLIALVWFDVNHLKKWRVDNQPVAARALGQAAVAPVVTPSPTGSKK